MRVILSLMFILGSIATAQPPVKMWEFDTHDASFGQSAAGDIDGDGRLELVFGCYRNDRHVYALNAEDGSLLWKVDAATSTGHGCNDVAPAIVDTDGDGHLEVIVPSSCNPVTYCFDGKSGAIKWAVPTRGSDSPPTVADIDHDGKLEILHGEFGGWVRCLNAEDGSLAWELAVDMHSWIQTAPTLLDADGDGELDFVVATWNRTEGDTNAVRAYRCSDRSLLWRTPLLDVSYHGSTVADFDGDGRPELAIGDYSGTLSVLNAEDGSIAWTMSPRGSNHYVGAPVSAGDLDGDGSCELVVVSWYSVIALSATGSELWNHTIPGGQTAFRGVALADVDGDALPDAVFGTSSGDLVALSGRTGVQLWSIDLAADYGDARFGLDHAPIIADLDNDDELDVFIVGGHGEYPDIENGFGRAYALSIGKGDGPPWLMFQHDVMRRGSMCSSATSGIRSSYSSIPQRLRLYPQPVDRLLQFSTAAPGSYRITNLMGQTMQQGYIVASASSIDVAALPPGMYMLLLDHQGALTTGTFVKFR